MAETRLVGLAGRPSVAEPLLTDEMLREIGSLLVEGNHKETVADYLGVDRKTWWSWEQRGAKETGTIFERFLHVVKRSMALSEILILREIRLGAEGWQSKAWMAERRFPQRWGRRFEVTIRREAERLAAELGVDTAELMAEAERIASEAVSVG